MQVTTAVQSALGVCVSLRMVQMQTLLHEWRCRCVSSFLSVQGDSHCVSCWQRPVNEHWRSSRGGRRDQPCLLRCALDLRCMLLCFLIVRVRHPFCATGIQRILRVGFLSCALMSCCFCIRAVMRCFSMQLPCCVLPLPAGGVLGRAGQNASPASSSVALKVDGALGAYVSVPVLQGGALRALTPIARCSQEPAFVSCVAHST